MRVQLQAQRAARTRPPVESSGWVTGGSGRSFLVPQKQYLLILVGIDGSTALAAVLVGSHLYVANVGDSRAVALNSGKAVPLSEDHKPNRKDERKRIEDAGGIIVFDYTWRVGGLLAMSRAFGNRDLKHYVKTEPNI
ncbi:hypothetical protein ABZP36_027884 [Zizania latifolia]